MHAGVPRARDTALDCLKEADALIEATGGRLFAPEVARIRGLALRLTDAEAANRQFMLATSLARGRGSATFATKAAADAEALARLSRSEPTNTNA